MLKQNLKALRTQKGISQSALAAMLGVSQQAVAKWESGKAEPDSNTLKEIAKYFNVSIDYLLDNEPEGGGVGGGAQVVLTDEEKALIDKFDALNDDGRKTLWSVLGSLEMSHAKRSTSGGTVGRRSTAFGNIGAMPIPVGKASRAAVR